MMNPPPYGPNGLGGLEEHIIRPVQLLWDRPDVEPSKRWNLLDQLMPLYSRQPKIRSGDFPTMRLMPEHYDSLTTYPQGPYRRLFLMKMLRNLQITTIPKEVMQIHRNRGVLIQPLEPDDSDDEPLLKRKLHNKYQLRFVNKVCEAYYTQEQIKADDGNLLNVALYDENNSKITSGPLSSASVEVVVLHGDFNANGQDYWTSEEFSSCVVCPQSGKGRSALGGDRVLVLVDGEASVGFAFFQETSSFARTGKFKMGVKMKITIEERIQEGISESFVVTSRRGKGLNSNSKPPLIKSPIATRELLEEGFTTLKGGDSDIFAKLKAEHMEQAGRRTTLGRDERLRRALAAFGGGSDVWELVDAALASAARDRPDELRARRDDIVERLYAGGSSGSCSNCDAPPPPPAAAVAEEETPAPASPEAEGDADADGMGEAEELGDAGDGELGLESKILAIKDFLEDPDQLEDEVVSLLQSLADMDITYKALQETDIGRHVNGLRKHPSGEVRRLVKGLIRKWKEIVDNWVRLHYFSGDGGSSIITDGDSPEKIHVKNHQSAQVSEFKYSPSPQRHNSSSSERINNGIESTMEAKRRSSPAPAYQNARQINNSNHSTTSSSASAKTMREQKDSLLDLDRLDSARKRLQENYQEAQNAKKQQTIQVMDISDIPKPKNINGFIRKGGGGGLPARHR